MVRESMTGYKLPGNPVNPLEAAPKQYVDVGGSVTTPWTTLPRISGATFSSGVCEYMVQSGLVFARFNNLVLSSAIAVGAGGGMTNNIWGTIPAAGRPGVTGIFITSLGANIAMCYLTNAGEVWLVVAESTGSARSVAVGSSLNGCSNGFPLA